MYLAHMRRVLKDFLAARSMHSKPVGKRGDVVVGRMPPMLP
jgi:hypothetical protein